jgi:hypothetical protein
LRVERENLTSGFYLFAGSEGGEALPGGRVEFTLEVRAVGGYSDEVRLEVAENFPGLQIQFYPDRGSPPYTSLVKIESSRTARTGEYRITIVGRGGGMVSSCTYRLVLGATSSPAAGTEAPREPSG